MEIGVAAQRPVQNGYTQELSKAQEAKNREQEPAREASEEKPAGAPRYDTFERTPSVGGSAEGRPGEPAALHNEHRQGGRGD